MEGKHQLSLKKMNQIILTGGMGFFIAIIFRYLGWTLYPFLVNRQIQTLMTLNNGTIAMDAFYEQQQGVLEIYIFNITNPEEFSEGQIATVEELGPYVYKQIKTKVDIEFAEEDTVSYRVEKMLYFDANKSRTLTESDIVTVLNGPLLVMAYLFENEFPKEMPYFSTAIPQILPEKQNLCISVEVKDLLFNGIKILCGYQRGYAKKICDVIRRKRIPSIRPIPNSEDLAFSYFYNYNTSRSKVYKIKRGNENLFDLGHIVEYDNQTFLSTWPNNSACRELQGTSDWEFFPFPQRNAKIRLLFPELCLSMNAHEPDKDKFGEEVVGFLVSTSNFYSKKVKCLCKENRRNGTSQYCMRDGVIDIERCTGEPFLMSFPQAAYSHYIDDVIGYKTPIDNEYYSVVILQPRSGFPIFIHKQLQTNIFLRKLDDITILKNISERMIPLVWFGEKIKKEIRSPHIDKVKVLIDKEIQVMTISGCLIGFGIVLLLVAYFMSSTPQTKKEIHQKIHSVRSIFDQKKKNRINELY